MADVFKFGGFLRATNKKREKEAGLDEDAQPAKQETQESSDSTKSMSQGEFSYGSEGMRRKRKE